MGKIFLFGKVKSKTAITILFYSAIIPIILRVYLSSKAVYGTLNFYLEHSSSKLLDLTKIIDTFAENMSGKINLLGTNDRGNFYILIIVFIVQMIVSIVIWKVICELLNTVFEYFETKSKAYRNHFEQDYDNQ